MKTTSALPFLVLLCGCGAPPRFGESKPPAIPTFDHLSATGSASLVAQDASGMATDNDAQASIEFTIAGNFATNGSAVVEIGAGSTTATLDMWAGGGNWRLVAGSLAFTAADAGVGDPYSHVFTLHGTDLQFVSDVGQEVFALSVLDAQGSAQSFAPTAPPTGDVDVATLEADSRSLAVCPACEPDGGDRLDIDADSSSQGIHLSLSIPVATIGASSSGGLEGSVTVDQSGPHSSGEWYFTADSATMDISGPLEDGADLSFVISDLRLHYAGMDDESGVNTDTVGDSSITMRIASADVSTTLYVPPPPDDGCDCSCDATCGDDGSTTDDGSYDDGSGCDYDGSCDDGGYDDGSGCDYDGTCDDGSGYDDGSGTDDGSGYDDGSDDNTTDDGGDNCYDCSTAARRPGISKPTPSVTIRETLRGV